MALRTAYRHAADGIRIPYAATDSGNHGFVDLRGRPDLAGAISEAEASPALRTLLASLAETGARIASLGCDLGTHEAARAPASRRFVAGGYLHLIEVGFAQRDARAYHALGKELEAGVADRVSNRNWELAFILQPIELNLEGQAPRQLPSLSICFYASAANRTASLRSREALLGALTEALSMSAPTATPGLSADGMARNV